MTNFEVDFLASPMDGRSPHIHQITNFRPYDNEDPIRLTEDKRKSRWDFRRQDKWYGCMGGCGDFNVHL
jgi:hypothetical protein